MSTESEITEEQIVDRLHWAVALTPIVTVLLFYSMIFHARLALGEWPSGSDVDPNEISKHSIPFGFHYMLVFVAIIMTSISPIAWIALLPQAHRMPNLKVYGIRFVIFVACFTLALWIGFTDTRNLNWFAD